MPVTAATRASFAVEGDLEFEILSRLYAEQGYIIAASDVPCQVGDVLPLGVMWINDKMVSQSLRVVGEVSRTAAEAQSLRGWGHELRAGPEWRFFYRCESD